METPPLFTPQSQVFAVNSPFLIFLRDFGVFWKVLWNHQKYSVPPRKGPGQKTLAGTKMTISKTPKRQTKQSDNFSSTSSMNNIRFQDTFNMCLLSWGEWVLCCEVLIILLGTPKALARWTKGFEDRRKFSSGFFPRHLGGGGRGCTANRFDLGEQGWGFNDPVWVCLVNHHKIVSPEHIYEGNRLKTDLRLLGWEAFSRASVEIHIFLQNSGDSLMLIFQIHPNPPELVFFFLSKNPPFLKNTRPKLLFL